MSPGVKYNLARLGLLVAAFLVVLPIPISLLLKVALALLISSVLSWFVLRGWREQWSMQLQSTFEKRKAEKEKLRSALAGDDETDHPTGTDDAAAGPKRTDSDQN